MELKKQEVSPERQLNLLKKIIEDIFGINTELDFSHYSFEPEVVRIKDIDWSEDLIEVLKRLKSDFYIDVEPVVGVEEINGKKEYFATLDVVLYPIEE